MPFKPAKTEALRSFVVLDSDDVLSGLAALDGGAVDEILTRTVEDDGSQIGGHVGGRVARAQGGKNRSRKVEEELRRRRTEHSAAAMLIDRLSDLQAIGEVEGELDEDVAAALTPGDTIRVRGEVVLHPLHQVDTVLRSFLTAAPSFDQPQAARDLKKILPMWDAMIGTGKSSRVLFDLATAAHQVPRVLVPVKKTSIQVETTDVPGHATLLAKVDRIVAPDDQVLALRALQNASVSSLELEAVEEAAVGMVEAFSEIGIPCSRDDLVMGGPMVVLRPLCIWR